MRLALRNARGNEYINMTSHPTKTITTSPNSQASSDPYTSEIYTRRADHIANTAHEDEDAYILTLHTDPSHHKRLTALRTKYFPPTLNKLSAHIALFRALPGSHLPTIQSDIHSLTSAQHTFPITTGKAFLLGRHGVAIDAHAPAAKGIYNALKEKWEAFLSKQDKSFRAHYTIQNKVDEEGVPERTLEEVRRDFEGSRGTVDGLSLFRYDRGYWRHVKDFMFAHSTDS